MTQTLSGFLPARVRPGRLRDVVGTSSLPGEVQSALAGTIGAGRARAWEAQLLRAVIAADCLALLGGVLAGVALRPGYSLAAGLLLLPLWLVALLLHSAYGAQHLAAGTSERKRVSDASLRLALVVLVVSYLFRAGSGRDLLLVTLPVGTGLLLAGRVTVRALVARLRRRGQCQQLVLAVGTVLDVMLLTEHARRTPSAGFVVVGACLPSYGGGDRRLPSERRASRAAALDRQERGDRRAESDRRGDIDLLDELGVPVVGAPHDVLEAVRQLGADTVAVAGHGALSRHALRRLAWQLEGTRVRLLVASVLTEVASPRITLQPLGGLPLLAIEAPAFGGVRRALKGGLDRILAALIVLLISPVLAGIATAIKLDSPGPVLYRQQRVGRDGRAFHCLKLRTMCVGADSQVAALSAQNEGDGVLFKIRADPRVTRVGRLLRRLSLDELPQLFNVLGGSMSLVGPRPPLPREVAEYGDDVRRRLLVKPGMTGLWQVSGRSDLSWAESVRLDLYYVENWSPLLDLSLMARTVTAVVAGRGAY